MKYTILNIRSSSEFGNDNAMYGGSHCWFWKTTKDKTQYMSVSQDGKQVSLHRLAYTLQHGKIPIKGVIDHLCDNKGCCNPTHLELVTHAENIRRAFKRKPRVRKENTRVQVTITVDDKHAAYVTDLAIAQFEGNMSMAIRKIIAEHSKKINFKGVDYE